MAEPLGPNAERFRRLIAVCAGLTAEQRHALTEANRSAYGFTDEQLDDPAGGPGQAAYDRAQAAAVAAGRYQPAVDAGMSPGLAWRPQLAVLTADLIAPADYEELTAAWMKAFGRSPLADQ